MVNNGGKPGGGAPCLTCSRRSITVIKIAWAAAIAKNAYASMAINTWAVNAGTRILAVITAPPNNAGSITETAAGGSTRAGMPSSGCTKLSIP